ncbi:MAG TPA: phosphatase PAP2 family protein [Thermomicrobiaceae bacterium]|nr:phosphatase PAP2 family protein [Thermomicrobiaceae bacterium]
MRRDRANWLWIISTGASRPPNVSPRRAERKRRSRLFIGSWLIALVGYLSVAVIVHSKRSTEADLAATIWFQRRQHPAVARLMNGVSWFGFRPQSLLLPATVVTGALAKRLWLEAFVLTAAWGASLMSFFTKLVVRRDRPAGPNILVTMADIRDTSFPSGHTLHYTAFWGMFLYLVWVRSTSRALRTVTVVVVGGLAALVGPSRIWLGHHWLTDVVASYLLGTCYLLGLIAVYQRLRPYFHREPAEPRHL